jgi:RNA polymerase sigma-70 factor (ECF subfamily)
MPSPLDDWFIREILVHEAALTRFLRRCWPHGDEIYDLRQEVYVRVYESARKALPATPRSYLFSAARNLMTDLLRRGRIVSIETMGDFDASIVLVDELSPERALSGRQALRRLNEAFDQLPDRCREVLWMRRVEELPQKVVAERLGITEKTVEKHVANGMRLITEYLGSGLSAPSGAAPRSAADEEAHERDKPQRD